MKIRIIAGFLSALPILGLFVRCSTEPHTSPPNIIILHVDDMGWTDLECYGSDFYETPNIDQLSREGIRFTNAYAPGSICSPSRASIQTGRYASELGITDWIRASFQKDQAVDYDAPPAYEENEGRKLRTPFNNNFLPLEEKTIAEYLKKQGYKTIHIGKWHLGDSAFSPIEQGYDINIAGCDYGEPPSYFDPYVRPSKAYSWGTEPKFSFPTLKPRREGEYLTSRLTDEALHQIRGAGDQAFFLFFNYYSVHTPLEAKEAMIRKYEIKEPGRHHHPTYAAMVESVDISVGRIVRLIDSLQLNENTLFIFTSDNGGADWITDNYPLRDGKGSYYEGGIRVPFIAKWSGSIEAGAESKLPFTTMQILPTLAEIIGFDCNTCSANSIAPALFGEKAEQVDDLFWHYPHYRGKQGPYSIIRRDSMKLIRLYEENQLLLFDVKNDISETDNLSQTHPEIRNDLLNAMKRIIKSTGSKLPMEK